MKLNYKKTILVGLAFLAISSFWQLYDFTIPLILKNNFKMNDGLAGFIMSLDNIIALFMLPLFGMFSDRLHTRVGRRMPFIVLGTIASLASMMFIPYTAHKMMLVPFIIVLGFVLITMATYRSPAVALMPDITPKPLRSKGNAVINLMGALGGAVILLVNAFLAPKNPADAAGSNYYPIFLVVAGIMLVAMVIVFFTINEPRLVRKMREDSAAAGIDPEEAEHADITHNSVEIPRLDPAVKKSLILILLSVSLWFMGYNAVTTAFSKYAVNALGVTTSKASLILMVAVIAATVSFIPVGIISTKVGRKKSILFGVVLLAMAFGSAFFYKTYSPLMFANFALAGVAWACINVNSLPMVLEMSKGANVGKYTGYYYTFSMAAQVATPILSGLLLQYVGYYTLMPYAAGFVSLSFITMMMVRHGDSRS
ncbi:MAG: MFS transporter [Saccharofermentanales bacterium]